MNTSKKLAWHTVAIAAAALVSAGAAHADSRRDFGDNYRGHDSRGHDGYREYGHDYGRYYGDGHRRTWRDRDYRYFNHHFESRRYGYPSYGYYRDYPSYRPYRYPYRHSVIWAAPDFNVGLYIPLR